MNTIAEHQGVLKKHQHVWFGKLGRPLGTSTAVRLNAQIHAGTRTFLFVTQYEGGGHHLVHRGELEAVSREVPAGEQGMIPPYYQDRGITSQVTLWMKLKGLEPMDAVVLESLSVASSGSPVRDSIRKAIGALFIVYGSPGE